MLLLPLVKDFTAQTQVLIEVFSFYILISSVNNFFFALFKGFEQLQHETKISFGINLLLFALLIVLGVRHTPIYIIALMFVATRVLGLFMSIRLARNLIQVNVLRFDFSGWKEIRRRVLTFGLFFLFGNLYFMLDTILLAFWKGDHDVGVYQSVFKLSILLLIIPDIAISALMPVLSRLHSSNEAIWKRTGDILNRLLFMIGMPITAIAFVYADQIIEIIYGARAFSESILILRIFSIIVFVRFS